MATGSRFTHFDLIQYQVEITKTHSDSAPAIPEAQSATKHPRPCKEQLIFWIHNGILSDIEKKKKALIYLQ